MKQAINFIQNSIDEAKKNKDFVLAKELEIILSSFKRNNKPVFLPEQIGNINEQLQNMTTKERYHYYKSIKKL